MKINSYLADEYLRSTEPYANRSKRKIIMSLIDMTTDKSVDKITVSALAKRAGIDRKTFYLHYRSIDDVFKDCDELVARTVGGFMKNVIACNPSKRFRFFDEFNRIIVENLDFFRDFLHSGAYKFFLDKAMAVIKEGLFEIIDNELPQLSERERALFEMSINGMLAAVLAIYLAWFNDDRGLTLDEIGVLSRNNAARVLGGFAQTYGIGLLGLEQYI